MNTVNSSEWAAPIAVHLLIPAKTLELMIRRRRQMIIHSHIYYRLDDNLVDDHTWQRWADELTQLQAQHGHQLGFYDRHFKEWNGSSGFDLPMDADIERVAQRLVNQRLPK